LRFGFFDTYGWSTNLVARVIDEGHEALLYCWPGKPPTDGIIHVGDGLVPKEQDYEEWETWCKQPDTITVFCGSGQGKKADALRASGAIVLGAGEFCDKLELNRHFGTEIAESIGAEIPPFEEFESLSECHKWAQKLGDVEVYFKSDKFIDSDATYGAKGGEDLCDYLQHLRSKTGDRTKCIVQQKIEGVPVSTGQWWNGRAFIGPYATLLEHKKFLVGDIGPSTGCSLNALWFSPESQIADQLGWKNLEPIFREHNAPPGFYDINAIIDKHGTAWYLEWTPRFGWDSEPTGFRLVSSLSGLFEAAALGTGEVGVSSDLAYATRLAVPPYPDEYGEWSDKHTCVGVPVQDVDGLWDGNFIAYSVMEGQNGLVMATPDGIVGLTYAQGNDIEKQHDEAMEFAKSIRCPGLMYRNDGAKVLMDDAKALDDAGINVHNGLLKKEPADARSESRAS
jgi:phosphoribosylamine-glycine ligase